MNAEDKELMARLKALQKRIKNFRGVLFDQEAKKYRAAITYNGRIHVLGLFDCELDAYKHYRHAAAQRPVKIDRFESPARIERLLHLAGRFPAPLRPDPIMSSSLDQKRNRNFGEA
jgi:hypothetical protein